MKVSKLTGPALDWSVAKAHGGSEEIKVVSGTYIFWRGLSPVDFFSPSTDWSQGGPIIERERLHICPIVDTYMKGDRWAAWVDLIPQFKNRSVGLTPLIAAMRCYVASKLGDEVDVPEELNE